MNLFASNDINRKYKISIIKTEPIRNIYDEINNEYYFHKEYIDKGIYNIDSNKEVKIKSSSYSQNIFTEGEYVIHEDYGLGIYSGLMRDLFISLFSSSYLSNIN